MCVFLSLSLSFSLSLAPTNNAPTHLEGQHYRVPGEDGAQGRAKNPEVDPVPHGAVGAEALFLFLLLVVCVCVKGGLDEDVIDCGVRP